ncbi:hypothetical protein [Pseudomonas sp. MBLB4136]|uniref:hypothetical protein n=1 Tax=Pseudomonas sp. MBLB4136 TaxID=3451558 RepID=UPI003F7542C3
MGETVDRSGDGCAQGQQYNGSTGGCEAPPQPCPAAGTSITAAVQCSLVGGKYVHTDSITVEGCGYTSAPNGYFKPYPNHDNKALTFCMATFAATGLPSSAGENNPDIPPEQTAPTPSEGNDQPSCLRVDTHEFCQDPKQPNCGTRDGNPYCYGETDTCGELNGQWVCLPNGARKCTYVNGSYECVDQKTGEKISYDSPDHPNNGGNADGNPNNDEQAPGNVVVGGGAQGTDKGATNKAINDLQQALTERLDAIGEALTEETESSPNAPEAPNERGSFDLDAWDQKIEDAKLELSTLTNQFGDLFQGVTDLGLSGSGGQLACETFTVAGKTHEICLSEYADQLSGIGAIIVFLAALLATYIIFIRE